MLLWNFSHPKAKPGSFLFCVSAICRGSLESTTVPSALHHVHVPPGTLSDDGIAFSDYQLLNLKDVVLSYVETQVCFPDMQTADGQTGFLGGHWDHRCQSGGAVAFQSCDGGVLKQDGTSHSNLLKV